jgi:uncharacterized protein
MSTIIFPNLPVKDLERSTAFYKSLGYEQNMDFSDENASCIVISDSIIVMLLKNEYFTTFTSKSVTDASKQAEVILGLSMESREAVDEITTKATSAGGTEAREAMEQEGFMYSRAFQDPDGHLWEVFYMPPDAVPSS